MKAGIIKSCHATAPPARLKTSHGTVGWRISGFRELHWRADSTVQMVRREPTKERIRDMMATEREEEMAWVVKEMRKQADEPRRGICEMEWRKLSVRRVDEEHCDQRESTFLSEERKSREPVPKKRMARGVAIMPMCRRCMSRGFSGEGILELRSRDLCF